MPCDLSTVKKLANRNKRPADGSGDGAGIALIGGLVANEVGLLRPTRQRDVAEIEDRCGGSKRQSPLRKQRAVRKHPKQNHAEAEQIQGALAVDPRQSDTSQSLQNVIGLNREFDPRKDTVPVIDGTPMAQPINGGWLSYEETLNQYHPKLNPQIPPPPPISSGLANAIRHADPPTDFSPLFEGSLKAITAKLGPDQPETLTTLHNLAVALQAAGRLNDAIEFFEGTLKLVKAKLGPEHPDTLKSMQELAEAYRAAGRVGDAVPSFEETLKVRKSTLGIEHPDTLRSMNNLAEAYRDAGRTNDAVALFEETVKLRKTTLGPEHPDTLISIGKLASAYHDAGRIDDMLSLFKEKFEQFKSTHGPEHPDPRTVRNILTRLPPCAALPGFTWLSAVPTTPCR